MNSILAKFQKKQPFIGFVTAGDGGLDYCVSCCLNLIAGGVDILEIGFPFSDPVADGPVIQASSQRALDLNVNKTTMIELARRLREHTDIPLIAFGYFNPFLKSGPEFLTELKTAGFDGVLIVDLPYSDPYYSYVENAGLNPIFVIAPSTDAARLENITKKAQGFLYYACRKGTTGARSQLPDDFVQHVTRIRNISSLPIVVGFGIADRSSARQVLDLADGFVVGSPFVKQMQDMAEPAALKKLAEEIDPRGAHNITN